MSNVRTAGRNEALAYAMVGKRASNAAGKHQDKRNKRTRTRAAKKARAMNTRHEGVVKVYQKTVKAKKVRSDSDNEGRGDQIPGLDNAYVYDAQLVDEYTVEFTLHDSEGGEMTLTCHPDTRITVDRRRP